MLEMNYCPNNYQYLVQIKDSFIGIYSELQSAYQIINTVDMMDCSSIEELKIFDVSTFGIVKELTLCSHDYSKDPTLIAVFDGDKCLFYGHGTNH